MLKRTIPFSAATWSVENLAVAEFRILKFEANLAKVLLGSVYLKAAPISCSRNGVDNGLQTIGRYRPNHVLLIGSAANGDPLIRI